MRWGQAFPYILCSSSSLKYLDNSIWCTFPELFCRCESLPPSHQIELTASCFWTVVLEKTIESPLDSKEIQPVHPKGNQPWIFIGRTDAKAEAPILWPPDTKCWLIGKDPDAGEDWGQKKGVTEDEMVVGHRWLNGHEFEQAPGDEEEQGSLACCSPWGGKESKRTEQLNNSNNYLYTWVYFSCNIWWKCHIMAFCWAFLINFMCWHHIDSLWFAMVGVSIPGNSTNFICWIYPNIFNKYTTKHPPRR